MRVLLIILTILISITQIFSQTSEKRVALVIGNKNYIYGGALTYPIQDAKTMKEVLEELNFEVIYLLDGTKTQMTTSYLQFIRQVENANISLIYYSGHGMQIDGVNHLIPVDANIIDKHSAREFTININNWVSQLEANEQNLNIVILDACRNNPFKAFTKSYEKGLKQIPAPSGTIISFATLPDNVAQDNGLFAETLAFEIRKEQRIIDVFMNTRNTIEAKTNKQQSPMEWVRYNQAVNLAADGNGSDIPADGTGSDLPVAVSSDSFDYKLRSIRTTSSFFIDPRDKYKYKQVGIGLQVWMAENLKCTKLNDGTAIPLVTDETEWSNLTTPGYCWYNNDKTNYMATYGVLYNWHAVKTGKLCPTGWHVPTDEEWDILVNNLGGTEDAGGKLKENSTVHWSGVNTGATNESGFTALPGGYRFAAGYFNYLGNFGTWWSATEFISTKAWNRYLSNRSDGVYRGSYVKKSGFSVRCLRD